MDFGRVLGGVWEAKIHDFRTFFDVFSMLFFKRDAEGEQIEKNFEKTKLFRFLASVCGGPQAAGERKRIGVRILQIELRERMSRLASCDC